MSLVSKCKHYDEAYLYLLSKELSVSEVLHGELEEGVLAVITSVGSRRRDLRHVLVDTGEGRQPSVISVLVVRPPVVSVGLASLVVIPVLTIVTVTVGL